MLTRASSALPSQVRPRCTLPTPSSSQNAGRLIRLRLECSFLRLSSLRGRCSSFPIFAQRGAESLQVLTVCHLLFFCPSHPRRHEYHPLAPPEPEEMAAESFIRCSLCATPSRQTSNTTARAPTFGLRRALSPEIRGRGNEQSPTIGGDEDDAQG